MNLSRIRDRVDLWSGRGVPIAVVWLAGLMWLSSVSWKVPSDFGDTASGCAGLCGFVEDGIEHPVVPGSGWVLDNIVQRQLALFGWITLLAETALAALLLSRRHLRIAAALGVAQSLAIGLTVANAPDEWYWAYLLMVGVHLAILSFAPGLRPTSAKAMAVTVGLYGAMLAVAHAEAGFTGDGNDTWTLFTGGNDIPDELGRGTFPGSIALGLLLLGVAIAAWVFADADQHVRVTAGWGLVAAAVILLLTYRSDGLLLGLGSKAVTAGVLAAVGLSLAPTGAPGTGPEPDSVTDTRARAATR
ncbi:MAG: hypothetical protein ACRD2C_11995 [Acidimicrobiales bacterium]